MDLLRGTKAQTARTQPSRLNHCSLNLVRSRLGPGPVSPAGGASRPSVFYVREGAARGDRRAGARRISLHSAPCFKNPGKARGLRRRSGVRGAAPPKQTKNHAAGCRWMSRSKQERLRVPAWLCVPFRHGAWRRLDPVAPSLVRAKAGGGDAPRRGGRLKRSGVPGRLGA